MKHAALLAAAACLALGGRAQAQELEDDVVGILQVSTQGVSETAGDLFEQSVEEGLAGTGFRIARSQALGQRLVGSEYVLGCTFGPCLRAVHEATGIRSVLVARIHGEGSSYGFVISLLDTRTGALTAQVTDTCEVCTVEEAVVTASGAVVALVTGTGEAEVVVEDPAGPVVVPGADSELERARSRRSSLRRAAWVVAGTGAVAAAAGAYLLTEDHGAAELTLGAGGGLLLGGIGMFLYSREF